MNTRNTTGNKTGKPKNSQKLNTQINQDYDTKGKFEKHTLLQTFAAITNVGVYSINIFS